MGERPRDDARPAPELAHRVRRQLSRSRCDGGDGLPGRTQHFGGGAFGITAPSIAHAKLQLGFGQAVALGILCNALVCLAVWLSYSARTTADRILAIVPPISAFVAAGFEHSIANMYFVPLGLFIAGLDPAFVRSAKLEAQAEALSWSAFILRNLLPVTIGNVIGGSVLVAAVYWFVYLRPGAPKPCHTAE
jgi:formate transporter